MSDNDEPASSAKRKKNRKKSSRDARHHTVVPDKMSDNEKSASPAQEEQDKDNSSSDLDARLDRVLKYYHTKAMSGKKNELSNSVTSLVRSDRDAALASARERIATLDRTLVQLLERAPPLRAPPPASMAESKEELLTNDQSSCLLFRLPPELRNNIYTYVFYTKYSLPQFKWDEEHNAPKLNLKCAQPRAPPNELLRTCRSIYNESKGIYVRAKTQFWSDTTFTLTLPISPSHKSFGYLKCHLDEQARHISRVNIDIESDVQPFTVHLRSGPEADSSVKAAVCAHRSQLPAPLEFIERVAAIDQVQGQLRYPDAIDILWFESRGPGSPWMRLCMDHHPEPVILSVRNLSRAGLIAVVAWACDAPKCRSTG